jgi:hypothetical protein
LLQDDYRAVEVFPPKGSSNGRVFVTTWYEDDGVSPPPARVSSFELRYYTTEETVNVELEMTLQPEFQTPWDKLVIILPAGDQRSVKFNGTDTEAKKLDSKGRAHFAGKTFASV